MTVTTPKISTESLLATAQWICGNQDARGAIYWDTSGQLDPWDHTEAAIGVTLQGKRDECEAALEFAASLQYPADHPCAGLTPHRIDGQEVTESFGDTNFTAYLAVGALAHLLEHDARVFIRHLWPAINTGLSAVADLIDHEGFLPWAVDVAGRPADEALLTGSSSVARSLWCGAEVARMIGAPEPDWLPAAARLRSRIVRGDAHFADRHRFAMDWYYPVLSGALEVSASRVRLCARWDEFVVPGCGSRCVADRPWVTVAETCELAMAFVAVGDYTTAMQLFNNVQHLRNSEGSYYTGYVFDERAVWPETTPTWTAAAVIMAADALAGSPCSPSTVGRLFQT